MAHMAHIVRTDAGEVIGAERLDPLQLGIGTFDRLYETSDGWVCLTVPDPDLQAIVCELLDVSIVENEDVLTNALTEAMAKRETLALLQELKQVGVTAIEPAGHHIHALLNDPEQRRIGRIVEYHDSTLGNVREVGALLRISDHVAPLHRPAPALGEHSDTILAWLGYDDIEIAELRARQIVR
jgi:crotonobetainyl-CoA:carnitine CoA-transferase CaiB-like acyl-CoA transferase